MAADVDSADSLISRCLATQLLNLIQERQDAVVKYRYFDAGPTKSSILLTFLTDLDDPWGRQGTHAVAPLLTPSQNEIAMQLAAGATAVRRSAAAGDLINTALDQRRAG
ncbi:MAG: hypothetical protein DMG40_23075 [Acidobacteria bacterium]|nr:MAG: hypothetical protein DMG40_23075 [Acidobacteriota bacterium]